MSPTYFKAMWNVQLFRVYGRKHCRWWCRLLTLGAQWCKLVTCSASAYGWKCNMPNCRLVWKAQGSGLIKLLAL
eukprot:987224-Amphidinium_carterae.1